MTPENFGFDVRDLISNAGPIAKMVLSVLGVFSIICWAVVFERAWLFYFIKSKSKPFLNAFSDQTNPLTLYEVSKKHAGSPIAQMWTAGCNEILADLNVNGGVSPGDIEPKSSSLESASRAMRKVAVREIARMERFLPILATTASTAPFIGLFGTVWGVMESFRGIGSQGSASLAVVAPGISEALIATAAGLGAAIPAVITYNFFVNRVKRWAVEMDGLSLDMINRLQRSHFAAHQRSDKNGY